MYCLTCSHILGLDNSAKADFYPFVLRTPGIKEMAQNESVNQIANYVERNKLPL